KKPYRTQVELAAEMLAWLRPLLPGGTKLVVLADSLFDGQRLFKDSREHGETYITKLKGHRTFADEPGGRVVAYGKGLAEGQFRRIRLCRGKEATAAYRRQEPRQPRAPEKGGYGEL